MPDLDQLRSLGDADPAAGAGPPRGDRTAARPARRGDHRRHGGLAAALVVAGGVVAAGHRGTGTGRSRTRSTPVSRRPARRSRPTPRRTPPQPLLRDLDDGRARWCTPTTLCCGSRASPPTTPTSGSRSGRPSARGARSSPRAGGLVQRDGGHHRRLGDRDVPAAADGRGTALLRAQPGARSAAGRGHGQRWRVAGPGGRLLGPLLPRVVEDRPRGRRGGGSSCRLSGTDQSTWCALDVETERSTSGAARGRGGPMTTSRPCSPGAGPSRGVASCSTPTGTCSTRGGTRTGVRRTRTLIEDFTSNSRRRLGPRADEGDLVYWAHGTR